MKFVIATKNAHKLIEMQRILLPMGIDAVIDSDIGKTLTEPEENGIDFKENALIKARSASLICGIPAIADDSGLCVDALGGAPGIYSARYAGEHGNSKANNLKLLSELKDVEYSKRTGRFVSAIACVFPDGREFCVEGVCEGYIAFEEKGTNGFGYDPLFISELGCFAELTAEEKDKVSHRGKAMKVFKEELKKYL